ncbi:GGDEF domain-containing protein [Anaeromicropila populeti]|uniref:Diguanylate cyclase (GGDEF) domain-containing protein n=1 Tax=Anaeromicropila populeti TaxID=37658 RepID=A0A1I6HJ42_9FIRM|nr:GGDEF domain-containing protein [Anaeromicropila populeti]SFR54483.1 diguanylate cyclase (GGDEF) domain-containing protein [Anaeromicropila populeti]
MDSTICIDILAIVVTLFTMVLAHKNVVIDRNKTKYFIHASVLTAAMLVLEIVTIWCQSTSNTNIIWLHIAANALGFALGPAVIIMVSILVWNRIDRFKLPFFIPFILNGIASLISIKTGWIFYVSPDNVYSRGDFFFINTVCCSFYLIILVYCNLIETKKYNKSERRFLMAIYLMVVAGGTAQAVNRKYLFIWGCVAVSLLLYYVFIRELQFRYDPLTNIYNRAMFEKEMERLSEADKVTIIAMDLNNLKKANDRYGHVQGDQILQSAASIIYEAFDEYGMVFRIGGDEFCVLCQDLDGIRLKQGIRTMEELEKLHNQNKKSVIPVEIAYGCYNYRKQVDGTLHDAYVMADKEMYKNKKKLKERIVF